MTQIKNSKTVCDLEEKTFIFTKDVRLFVKTLKYSIVNNYDNSRKVIKSSGSVGANYREANEALKKKIL
ncbi:MAG: hypothetical protein GH151_14105 [Bacteroidetes bacterium]|nr:hypothetical protein [Bacteroidota bacterium]MQY80298.1 hypothetical protein [Bacteroidota bacterium]